MGQLTPIFIQDVLPGDKFRVNSEIFLRFAPLLAPVMHQINCYVHYFFVPNRLVWNEWEDFITGGSDGTSDPVMPFIQVTNAQKFKFGSGSLADYMGIPTVKGNETVVHPLSFSALPFRAYQLIFDEYYRDQNLREPVACGTAGGEVTGETNLQKHLHTRTRAWEKDYFTSALPWAQRGPEVLMPLDAEINYHDETRIFSQNQGSLPNGAVSQISGVPGSTGGRLTTSGGDRMKIVNIQSIENGNITINDLRRSIKLQEWLEKNARAGSRYIEQILSHFGVKSSDSRLQRPEYLGGGKAPVTISEVLSSFQDGASEPQGNMSGHAVSVGRSNSFKKSFEEHGYIIGIMSVIPRTAYQQGLPRHFSKFDRFDHYWPEFANIGEQEIKMKELFTTYDGPNQNEQTFGYQSRYAEYKFQPTTVHGNFKDTLAYWHMGRIFENAPDLNNSFVSADPTDRIFAVNDGNNNLYCQIFNKVDALRPLPYFGTPTL
jgi:hypothetical protein